MHFKPTIMSNEIKKGSIVQILRPESYWYLQYGQVMTVLQDEKVRYGVQVRFDSENYAGLNTNSYNLNEVALKQ